MKSVVYDLIGIGIGPFNLGLAALLDKVKQLNCLFIDQKPQFDWHPGMMIPGARMQVPFYADLVTLADPASPYSFLNYLHIKEMHFRFANSEMTYPLRKDFCDYYKWVASLLHTLKFNCRLESVQFNGAKRVFLLKVKNPLTKENEILLSKRIVIGIGSAPYLPPFAIHQNKGVIHSSAYLLHHSDIVKAKDVAVVGSGQSAAEIFLDLLNEYPQHLKRINWYGKDYFAPMDDSKLTIEMTTPGYVDYFFRLPIPYKLQILKRQNHFYKGISRLTLNAIAEKLYVLSSYHPINDIGIYPNRELLSLRKDESCRRFELSFLHKESGIHINQSAKFIVLATGYTRAKYHFLKPITGLHEVNGEYYPDRFYAIDNHKRIFLQNAELHSHGFNSADLELGPRRNAVIINSILGYKFYHIESGRGFQCFD